MTISNITAIYTGPDGQPVRGRVVFTPTPEVIIRDTITVQKRYPVTLVNGELEVSLPATDTEGSQIDWTYHVEEQFEGGRSYYIFAPTGDHDLADLATIEANNGVYVVRGHKGDKGDTGAKGDKGDTGVGVVDHLAAVDPHTQYVTRNAASVASTVDLNTLTTPGSYAVHTTGATTALNYPIANFQGTVHVENIAARTVLTQRAVTSLATGLFPAGSVWTRGMYGSTWGPWQQLEIRRDTGWRILTADLATGWTAGALQIRRINDVVHLRIYNLIKGTGAVDNTLFTIPAEFHHLPTSGQTLGISVTTTGTTNGVLMTGGNRVAQMYPNGSATAFFQSGMNTFSWQTSAAWPTVLPGTAG